MAVDEFVEAKVLPQYRPIVALVRKLFCQVAPDAEEVIYYGQPMYRYNNRAFAWITPSKSGVSVGFLGGGTSFGDKYGLLRGEGKASRNVKFTSLEQVNEEALVYYIAHAAAMLK